MSKVLPKKMCAEHLNINDESKIIVKDGKTMRAAFVTDKI